MAHKQEHSSEIVGELFIGDSIGIEKSIEPSKVRRLTDNDLNFFIIYYIFVYLLRFPYR